MTKDDLMKADLLSEIVVLGSGIAILVAIVMVIALAITRTPAM